MLNDRGEARCRGSPRGTGREAAPRSARGDDLAYLSKKITCNSFIILAAPTTLGKMRDCGTPRITMQRYAVRLRAEGQKTKTMRKYRLTKETITITRNGKEVTLHRIEALRDFAIVKAGDKDGFIENEKNLAHKGDCWIFGNAEICDNAWIYGNACVYGDAKVGGNAQVYDNAKVYGSAKVFGYAEVFGYARVFGNAWVFGSAHVFGDAEVYGNAKVCDNAWIYDNAEVFGSAMVYDNAKVCGDIVLDV